MVLVELNDGHYIQYMSCWGCPTHQLLRHSDPWWKILLRKYLSDFKVINGHACLFISQKIQPCPLLLGMPICKIEVLFHTNFWYIKIRTIHKLSLWLYYDFFAANSHFILQISHAKTFKMKYTKIRIWGEGFFTL